MFKSLTEIKKRLDIHFNNEYLIFETEILNIFNGNIIETKNPILLNCIGLYYKYIEENYDKMKEYFLIAIELKNPEAIHNLGDYYQYVERNYDKMLEYYLIGIELGNSNSMNNLEYYYENNLKDFFNLLLKQENKNYLIINKLKELLNKYNKYYIELNKNSDKTTKKLYENYFLNKTNNRNPPDFKIKGICNDEMKEYLIHSIVLNSPYFDILFSEDYKKQEYIIMYVTNFETINNLIKYLYLDIIPLDKESCNNLLILASEYGFEDLINILNIYLFEEI